MVTAQVRVTLPPAGTVALSEFRVILGGSATISVRSITVLPPDPVQVSVNFLSPGVRFGITKDPEVVRSPLHAPPLARHDVAFALDQLKVMLELGVVDGALRAN